MSKRSYAGAHQIGKRQKHDIRFHDIVTVLLQHRSSCLVVVDLARLMQASRRCLAQVESWLRATVQLPTRLKLYSQIHRPAVNCYLILTQNISHTVYPVPTVGRVTIGRSSKNNVQTNKQFSSISRQHIILHCLPNKQYSLDVYGRLPLRIERNTELPRGTRNHPLSVNQLIVIPMPHHWISFQLAEEQI